MSKYYFSSTCSGKKKLSAAVEELYSCGIKNIELSGNLEYYPGMIEDLRKIQSKYDIRLLIHNYFPPAEESFVLNLASGDTRIIENSFSIVRSAVELAKEFGVPHYSVHSGYRIKMLPELFNNHFMVAENTFPEKTSTKENFYKNIMSIINSDFAGKVKIAVENLFPMKNMEDYSIISKPEEIDEFLKFSNKYDNLGMLIDLGHLNITASRYSFDPLSFSKQMLRKYKNKIIELHISGNNGDYDRHEVNRFGDWQFEVIEYAKSLNEDVFFVFEWVDLMNKDSEMLKIMKKNKLI